jgi:hypothetical protein
MVHTSLLQKQEESEGKKSLRLLKKLVAANESPPGHHP